MTLRTLAGLGLIAVLMSAPVAASAASADRGRVEVIYGARFDESGLTVRVESNGCTSKEDFRLDVRRSGKRVTILITRIKADPCNTIMRGHRELLWTLEELKLKRTDQVRVLNRFGVW